MANPTERDIRQPPALTFLGSGFRPKSGPRYPSACENITGERKRPIADMGARTRLEP